MGKIQLLDENTIQKIAAGEVIERPASIVKELVENSIDANATNITIEIKDGGKSYIRVTDDGDGISEEDIALAFKRHSTSKLRNVDDLHKILSLGFRGEALASISHVAKVEVMTKTNNSLGGTRVTVEEGEILSQEVVGSPKGTTFIISDLFYNLPVRKEFLKSSSNESNSISDIIYKIALGNTNVSFKFIKDDKIILKTSKNNEMKSHIYSVLGKEFSQNLIEINMEIEDISLRGYFSNNQLYRSNRSHQYIYVNGRYIYNSNISNLIERKYRSIIPLNRFPCFILFIDIDPAYIDVNIHPTKQEIKFSNQDQLFNLLSDMIDKVLFNSISVPSFGFKSNDTIKDTRPLLINTIDKTTEDLSNKYKDLVVKDFTQNNLFEKSEPTIKPNIIQETYKEPIYVKEVPSVKEYLSIKEEIAPVEENKPTIDSIIFNLTPVGVVFNTYIICEDKVNEKIYFIDQHAAHERVMYEKFLKEYKEEQIVTQQLIAPEIIDLTNKEINVFTSNIDVFKALGFDIELFGLNSVAIRGVPLIFGIPKIKTLFLDLLDNIKNINTSYDTKIERIMKLACINAVKAGDKISNIEIDALFEQLKKCENPHSCPHGRPTMLEMTKKEIEKGFLRIM